MKTDGVIGNLHFLSDAFDGKWFQCSFYMSKYPQSHVKITPISLTFLALYLLSIWSKDFTLFNPQDIFMTFFFVAIVQNGWILKNDVGIRLIVVSIVMPFLLFLINYAYDESHAQQYFVSEHLIKLTFFTSLGFWIGGSLRNIYIFLTLSFLGLLICLMNVDITVAFQNIFSGQREGFSFNPQHIAMIFGLSTIALLSFFPNLLFSNLPSTIKITVTALYLFALAISIIVFIGTQTRAALIALIIAFSFSVLASLKNFYYKGVTQKLLISFIIYTLSSSIVLYNASKLTFNKRGTETMLTESFLENQQENIPDSSLGLRLQLWIEASHWIKQKPLQGWGGGVIPQVVKHAKLKAYLYHTHNGFIELIVSYGIFGLSFVIFIFSWVNKKAYLLAKENHKNSSVWYFTMYGSLFVIIINMTEPLLYSETAAYALGILFAPAYSLHLSRLYSESKENKID